MSLSRWLPLFACIAFETAKCIGDRAPHVGMNIRPRAADRYEGIPLRQATKAFVRIRADRKLKLKSATEDREAFRPVAKVPAEPALEVQDCPPLAKSQDDAGQVSRRALVGIRKFSSLTVLWFGQQALAIKRLVGESTLSSGPQAANRHL